MTNAENYFRGMREGEKTIITIVNFTINAFKEDATDKELEFLNDLQEEIDACAEFCGVNDND